MRGHKRFRKGNLIMKRSCHSTHFGKISEMKSISKPPLPIEIYTICQNVSLDNFRKNYLPKGPEKIS